MKGKADNVGWVYILTNPSFREDWVKIGKSARPVDIRSKELDNTAVPLPFEIYATPKSCVIETTSQFAAMKANMKNKTPMSLGVRGSSSR